MAGWLAGWLAEQAATLNGRRVARKPARQQCSLKRTIADQIELAELVRKLAKLSRSLVRSSGQLQMQLANKARERERENAAFKRLRDERRATTCSQTAELVRLIDALGAKSALSKRPLSWPSERLLGRKLRRRHLQSPARLLGRLSQTGRASHSISERLFGDRKRASRAQSARHERPNEAYKLCLCSALAAWFARARGHWESAFARRRPTNIGGHACRPMSPSRRAFSLLAKR